MAKEYIWIDANEREYQVSGPASAAFEAGYMDRKIAAHQTTIPLDHPDGSVDLDKLGDDVTAYFAKQEEADAHEQDKSNPHGVTKTQVGLGNADNTADLDKPISAATQAALECKQNTWLATTTGSGAAYTVTLDPAPTALYTGMRLVIIPHVSSTSKRATLSVNGLGAKEIRQRSSNTNIVLLAEANDFLTAGKPAGLLYDGTYWIMTEFSRPAWWDIRNKPTLFAPENIIAGENVEVSVSGDNVTISAAGGGSGGGVTVVDHLDSTSAISALSANQGRALDEKIDSLEAETENALGAKAPTSHASTSATYGAGSATQYGHVKLLDTTTTTQSGQGALDAHQGNVLKQAVDGKLAPSDLVEGDNITLETENGKVTVSATGGTMYSGRSEYISNHTAGTTYTNTIPVPAGMTHAIVFITQRASTNVYQAKDVSGLTCYIDNTIDDILVRGAVNGVNYAGAWSYGELGFITAARSVYGGTEYYGRYAVGGIKSYITAMALTNQAITMTVSVGETEEGNTYGYGYFVDWVVWK